MDYRPTFKYKILENNLGENLDDLGCGGLFLDTIPKTQSIKEIIDQLDFTKIRNFCSAKDNVKRMRRQPQNKRKSFQKTALDQR